MKKFDNIGKEILIPDCWDDILFEQYTRLNEKKDIWEKQTNDFLKIVNVLTLITPYPKGEFLTFDVNTYNSVIECLKFMELPPHQIKKDYYILDNEKYFLKEKLDLITVGEQISFEICTQNLKDDGGGLYAVALLLRKDLSLPFDPEDFTNMILKVKQLPITDFLYISSFFLRGVLNYIINLKNYSKLKPMMVQELLGEGDTLMIINGME